MIQLIQISNNNISLEYDFEDKDAVHEAVSQTHPGFSVSNRTSYAILEVGGAKLIADSDVGGLCLISSDEMGNSILREIFQVVLSRKTGAH